MPASSRTVYGRPLPATPVWMWILQRASGLLLGPLVALHVWLPGWAANRALSAVLLAVVLAHGYSGVRRLAASQPKLTLFVALALLWCVVVGIAGALVVVAP
jgi:succinate dehydrogenase hydrophobic anchor subunit